MKTIKFFTLGCKVNQYDTQSIRERFLQHDFKELSNGHKADFYVINTCTVTSTADRKSREMIKKAAKENPAGRVIVTGCMVKKDTAQLARIKGVSCIISKGFFPDGIKSFSGRTRAFLKIQDGCNNVCSYCKVPLVRGSSRSKDAAEIVGEAEALVQSGFKEIVLCGVCLGSYGKELMPRIHLSEVIERLEKIKGLLRIRLSSIELNDISERLIVTMTDSGKLCRHLHIPLQSGDDFILRQMRRRYSRDEYVKAVIRLKKKIPNLSLTTDVIVGFPSEKEEHFLNTVRTVKECMPLKVHIFPYSYREGTYTGAHTDETVDYKIVAERINRLSVVAAGCAQEYAGRFIHKTMDVLIEGAADKNMHVWQGYTDNYLKVLVPAEENVANKMVQVKLTKRVKDYLVAEAC